MHLRTTRLRLVPATAALVGAEIGDPAAFAQALDAAVPANWPPDELADALPFFLQQLTDHPECTGWLAWYGILRGDTSNAPAILIASGGFLGPPVAETVEIGYSVLPQYQRWGYATEMMSALTDWASTQTGVQHLLAETTTDNVASLRVLEKLGFAPVGAGRDAGSIRFERSVGQTATR